MFYVILYFLIGIITSIIVSFILKIFEYEVNRNYITDPPECFLVILTLLIWPIVFGVGIIIGSIGGIYYMINGISSNLMNCLKEAIEKVNKNG